MRLPNRRDGEVHKISLLAAAGHVEGAAGDHPAGHRVHITLGRDPATGQVREIFFVGRGKSGHGLDQIFVELGVKLSRILQDRDPETGDERS